MPDILTDIHAWLEADKFSAETHPEPPQIRMHLDLTHAGTIFMVTVQEDQADLAIRLPVHAPEARRAAVGEFLHRLNRELHWLQWRFDPDDGEIICRHPLDLAAAPLERDRFRCCMSRLAIGVDGMLPTLLGVLGGGLSPRIAVEQAIAGIDDLLCHIQEECSRPDTTPGPPDQP